MISVDEALNNILEHAAPLPSETVGLVESVGRILAQDLVAAQALPPFDNSAMDGYAVKALDTVEASKENPVNLCLDFVIHAGDSSQTSLQAGRAMKIMTGAPVPNGADAVVIKERTIEEDGLVQICHSPRIGDNIRRSGEDVKSGDILLNRGRLIRPYEIAILAAQGIGEIPVVRRPNVAIAATGSELVNIHEKLSPGKIRNSNGPAIAAALSKWGIQYVNMGIVKDNPDEIEEVLKKALSETDVIIISGGVSVGEFDYTRSLLEKLMVKEIFWKVAMKPGKPFLFGVYPSGSSQKGYNKLAFGLPGNPISTLVCLEEFIRPALEKLQGYSPNYPSYHLKGKSLNDYPLPANRQQYLFCKVERDHEAFRIRIIRPQGSAMMGMACQSNALVLSPPGLRRIKQGDVLSFRWLK